MSNPVSAAKHKAYLAGLVGKRLRADQLTRLAQLYSDLAQFSEGQIATQIEAILHGRHTTTPGNWETS